MKILIPVMFAACAQAAVACDICAIYSATQARGEMGSGPFVGVAEQYTRFGTVQVDGEKVPNPSNQHMDSSVSQLFAEYGFKDRFGVQFNVPLIYRAFRRPDEMGGIDNGTVSGIGDVSLLATVVPWRVMKRDVSLTWTILGGVKFPTGDSDRLKEEFNEVEDPVGPPSGIHGHDLALGSGSYDGIVGTGIYARWRRLFLTASGQYTIRSEGDFDYQYADDLTWVGGPGIYLVLNEEWSLALQAVVSGEDKAKDTFEGEEAEDTAVTSVYLGPALTFTWGERLSATLAADLPVSIDNSALQTVPDYRIRAGLTWHF